MSTQRSVAVVGGGFGVVGALVMLKRAGYDVSAVMDSFAEYKKKSPNSAEAQHYR